MNDHTTSTVMMETKETSKMLIFNSTLAQLVAQEDFSTL
jgi:hypothetical protein